VNEQPQELNWVNVDQEAEENLGKGMPTVVHAKVRILWKDSC